MSTEDDVRPIVQAAIDTIQATAQTAIEDLIAAGSKLIVQAAPAPGPCTHSHSCTCEEAWYAAQAKTDLTTQLTVVLAQAEEGMTLAELNNEAVEAQLRRGAVAVLEFLTSTGLLVPAGGRVLTAEQVEDVRTVLGELECGGLAFEAAHARLRALFPATEPAAVRDGDDLVTVKRSHTAKAVQQWMTLDLWTDLGKHVKDFDAEFERRGFAELWSALLGEVRALFPATEPAEAHRVHNHGPTEGRGLECPQMTADGKLVGYCIAPELWTAPAVPAEEETKADWCILCHRSGHNHAAHKPQAPSPVVPATTETEVWQTAADVPDDVRFAPRDFENVRFIWMRCGKGSSDYADLNDPQTTAKGYQIWDTSAVDSFAPFVAAGERDA